jgi:hypothetical protein
VIELGAVAGFGGLFPVRNVVELVDFLEAVEDWVVSQRVELVAAEIVGAAFHVADLERTEKGFEEGNVFEVELLLEIFGAGGDDDALVALAGEAEGGKEVGEGLAGAGAGFDDEMALVFEGGLDGSGHVVLAAAMLEGEGGVGEDAAGGEEVVEVGKAVRDRRLCRDNRNGRRGGHQAGYLMIAVTLPLPWKVRKVFEVDTLGSDLKARKCPDFVGLLGLLVFRQGFGVSVLSSEAGFCRRV